tara:strand:- start:1608 stop:2645 length:1038 start_codon:yes stop_codon:yes gene_type:complete
MTDSESPKNIEEIYEEAVGEETSASEPEALEEQDGLEEDSSELPVEDEADVELGDDDYTDDVDEDDDDSEFDQELFGSEEGESDDTEEPEVDEEPDYEEEDEVAQLRDLLAQQQRMNAQLVEHMKQQQKPVEKSDGQAKRQQPRRTLAQAQFEDAFRLILYGNNSDKEEFESLPAHIRKQAAEATRHFSREESLNAIYPERRYRSQMQHFVQQEINNALKELRQDFHNRKAKDVFAPYADKITEPEDRKRLGEIMLQIPGADSTDWNVQRRVLDLAVKEVLREKEYADLKNRSEELEAKERQFKAAKRSRRRSRSKQSSSQSKKTPALKPGMDLVEYAQFLRKGE